MVDFVQVATFALGFASPHQFVKVKTMQGIQLNQEVAEALLRKWDDNTVHGAELQPPMPMEDLLVEALSAAKLFEKNWETKTTKGVVRHGLDSVAQNGRLSKETGTEVRELCAAAAECSADYSTLVKRSENAPLARGQVISAELRAGLSYVLEDGTHSEGEEQLLQLRSLYDDPGSMRALAMALESYAELAQRYQSELQKMPRFPLSIIDEALSVAEDLRARSADQMAGGLMEEQRQALALRNRLVFALMERVGEIRRAIRYVFREEPALVRLAGSAYERKRRKASRQKATDVDDATTETEPTLDVPT